MNLAPTEQDLLLVIDVQNDFLPGGALAVPDGHAIVPLVNSLARRFQHVALTQDWHPDHCVQGTAGAEFAPGLDIAHAQLVVRKGYRGGIDSYSAFLEADRRTSTGLAGYLRERGFKRLFMVGLATDFCVAWSAVDARRVGFDVVVIEEACRAIDMQGSLENAWKQMRDAGTERASLSRLLG